MSLSTVDRIGSLRERMINSARSLRPCLRRRLSMATGADDFFEGQSAPAYTYHISPWIHDFRLNGEVSPLLWQNECGRRNARAGADGPASPSHHLLEATTLAPFPPLAPREHPKSRLRRGDADACDIFPVFVPCPCERRELYTFSLTLRARLSTAS